MKKFTQIIGLSGLVILALGFVALLLQRRLNSFISFHILLGTVLAVFGLLSNLGSLREFLKRRTTRTRGSIVSQLVLSLVLVIALYYIVGQYNYLLDITEARLYTLSKKSKELLKNLPGLVHITAFFPSDAYMKERHLLELYGRETTKIDLKFVDPDKHPEIAEKKGISAYGMVLFEYLGRSTRIKNVTEEEVTNAILKVTRETAPVIYFLNGHGEADIDGKGKAGLYMLAEALRNQNYEVKNLVLTPDGVPDDASCVAIVGPRIPLQPGEIQVLDKYIGLGGDMVVLLDPLTITNLEGFFEAYGLVVNNDIVIDPVNYLIGEGSIGVTPIISKFGPHPITDELDGKLLAFPRARSLKIEKESWLPLAYSSSESFAETDLKAVFERGYAHADPEDPKGELIVASAYLHQEARKPWEASETKYGTETRIVVVGNSRFLRNSGLEVYSNFIFAMNIFNWTAGEQDLVSIRATKRVAERIFLTNRQTQMIFYATVVVLPEILLIVGFSVWWKRR